MRNFLFSLCLLLSACPVALCGDNSLDEGEACDDGNRTSADGCEANCSLPACQNGIVDPGELCFFAPVTFDTDTSPQGVVAADLNEDGSLDIATANAAGKSLGVLLGDGIGGFARLPDIDLDGAGIPLVVGDFDQDGHLDLATFLELVSPVVEVFRGLGDGSFVPLVSLPTSGPDQLTTGDFNRDGALDLAVGGDGVEVFLNNGAGGFLPSRFFSSVSFVASLSAADVNDDGDLDLIATHGTTEDALRVLLGDGAGNFSLQPPQPAGQVPGKLLATDLNGDSVFDLAVGRFFASEVSIFAGNGLGTFSEVQTLSVRSPSAMASGDVNGDGVLDLAVASGLDQANNAHLAIALGEGAGSFAAPLLFSVGLSDPIELVLADLNQDGALDVALTDQFNAQVIVFLSQP